MKGRIKSLLLAVCIVLSCYNTSMQVHAKKSSKDSEEEYVVIESQKIGSKKKKTYKLKTKGDSEYLPVLKGSKGNLQKIRKNIVGGNQPIDLPEAVIGDDGRNEVTNTTRVPYRYIGELECTFKFNKGNWTTSWCTTAFLVGKSIILTAAHCVYRKDYTLVSAVFRPAKSSSKTPYQLNCGTVHVPQKFKNAVNSYDDNKTEEEKNKISNNIKKYDYALVQLKQNIGNELGYFALGGYNTSYDNKFIVGKKCVVVGYPSDKKGLWRHKGAINDVQDGLYLRYQMDTYGGQSGSPVFYPTTNGQYYVVGIHRGYSSYNLAEWNYARYISKNIYELVKKWR